MGKDAKKGKAKPAGPMSLEQMRKLGMAEEQIAMMLAKRGTTIAAEEEAASSNAEKRTAAVAAAKEREAREAEERAVREAAEAEQAALDAEAAKARRREEEAERRRLKEEAEDAAFDARLALTAPDGTELRVDAGEDPAVADVVEALIQEHGYDTAVRLSAAKKLLNPSDRVVPFTARGAVTIVGSKRKAGVPPPPTAKALEEAKALEQARADPGVVTVTVFDTARKANRRVTIGRTATVGQLAATVAAAHPELKGAKLELKGTPLLPTEVLCEVGVVEGVAVSATVPAVDPVTALLDDATAELQAARTKAEVVQGELATKALHEDLMRLLFRLDDVGGNASGEARHRRKQLVKEVQALQEQLCPTAPQ